MTDTYCEIPITELTKGLPDGKFLLQYNQLVRAKVRAANIVGLGDYLMLNSDNNYAGVAYVQTPPQTPTNAPSKYEASSTPS